MSETFEKYLQNYANLMVKVGLNVQPGQRILIYATLVDDPVVRQLVHDTVKMAYQAGARLVDVFWRDEQLTKIRLQYAPEGTLDVLAEWRVAAREIITEEGGGLLFILADDPDLLADQDQDRISLMMKAASQAAKPARDLSDQGYGTWSIAAVPSRPWADVMLPDLPEEERIPRLWEYILDVTRANTDDPVAAWRTHANSLMARARYLTNRGYQSLKITGPGTDLEVGLVSGHIWLGGGDINKDGIIYMPNMPTEEVFTMPHRNRVNGTVRATKPLSYAGTVIDDFSITFENGEAVDYTAGKGGEALRRLLEMDEGACRLGEMALAPNSSPIAKTGRLFYETLFDENASIHIALGSAYHNTVQGGTELNDEEITALGGNVSITHVDFMIGSGEVNVEGVLPDGRTEPVMRGGEWAFEP